MCLVGERPECLGSTAPRGWLGLFGDEVVGFKCGEVLACGDVSEVEQACQFVGGEGTLAGNVR